IREQTLVKLALHALRERRRVAPDDLHADELDRAGAAGRIDQTGITFARATRAVTGARQEQLQIQFLELELETAAHAPARLDVPLEVAIELGGEPGGLGARPLGVARGGAHKQAVG